MATSQTARPRKLVKTAPSQRLATKKKAKKRKVPGNVNPPSRKRALKKQGLARKGATPGRLG